jgi:hypothetical protein
MLVRRPISVLFVMATLFAASLVPAPAVAFSPGFDSEVGCYSRTVSTTPWEIKLRRLLVMPPKLDASSTQRVGWRFIVQRSKGGVWTRVYRSPVQRALGDAAFTQMGVKVTVPAWPTGDSLRSHPYRVLIKAFWYRADGSIKATAKSVVDDYAVWIDGTFARSETGSCYGRERDLPDATPDTAAPSVPADLSGATGSTGEALLSWRGSTDDRPGPITYEVLRNGLLIATVAAGEYADFRGGAEAATYEYTVRAVDAAGNVSGPSSAVEVTVDPALFPFTGVVSRYGDRSQPKVALTFDDCVHMANVSEVVRILRANDAAASFFCRGDQLAASRATFADIARDSRC